MKVVSEYGAPFTMMARIVGMAMLLVSHLAPLRAILPTTLQGGGVMGGGLPSQT